ncbi:copper fist DNA binding domain-containing protein, partial [Mycena maculata]
LISSKKYACETCIKGHRSSACKHTDRPLFEIKKKGRPVTQCEHCRELRKTKQVHVKCICEAKDKDPSTSTASPSSPTSPNTAPKKKGVSIFFLKNMGSLRRRYRHTHAPRARRVPARRARNFSCALICVRIGLGPWGYAGAL